MTFLAWLFNAAAFVLMFIVLPLVSLWALAQWVGIFTKKNKTPRDIAEERYARGEISAPELEEIKRHLS